jgi:hypothetical protein
VNLHNSQKKKKSLIKGEIYGFYNKYTFVISSSSGITQIPGAGS